MTTLLLFMLTQVELFDPAKVGAFADHLYTQEDYSAALNEYRRHIFLADSLDPGVLDRIIDCLVRLERYGEAISETERIADANKRNYTRGLVHFMQGAMDSSRACLEAVDIPYRADARRIIGLAYAYEYRFEDAGLYIPIPRYAPARKQPALGGLCAIFPGGGHMYAGRWGDGFYSLFIIGTGALLSYYFHEREESVKFGFTLGTTLLLYAGNIYGGINAARNYNRASSEEYLDQIIEMNQHR